MLDGWKILKDDMKALIDKYRADVINDLDNVKAIGDILIIPFRNYNHMAYTCIEKYTETDYKVFIFNGGLYYDLFTGEDKTVYTQEEHGKRYVKACIRTTKDPKVILMIILNALFSSEKSIDDIFQTVSVEVKKLSPFYPDNDHDELIEYQEYGNCPLFNLFITIRKVKPDSYDLLKKAIAIGARPYLEAGDLLNLKKFMGITDNWDVFKVFSIIKTIQHIGHHC